MDIRELCWVMEILTPWQVCGFHKYMHLSKLIKLHECISMDANYTLILICPLKRTLQGFPNPYESFGVHPGEPTLHLDITRVVRNKRRHFGTQISRAQHPFLHDDILARCYSNTLPWFNLHILKKTESEEAPKCFQPKKQRFFTFILKGILGRELKISSPFP